jgi:hypothetical protein
VNKKHSFFDVLTTSFKVLLCLCSSTLGAVTTLSFVPVGSGNSCELHVAACLPPENR